MNEISKSSKLDDKGLVISQTETGRAAPKTFYFKYDARGNMVEKGTVANQPTETRGYDPLDRLTNVLYYDAQGYPKEVLNITYETYRD